MAPPSDNDPTKMYAISPGYMERMIDWYLTPVIDRLGELRDGYAAAHGEVKAAHDSEAPGWFGGEGNGRVKPATSSFLNEVGHQVEQLAADQSALASSLANYRAFLLDHADWARRTDRLQADRFEQIQRELEGFRW